MNQTHRVVRDAHALRKQRRKVAEGDPSTFDSFKAVRDAGKVAVRADRAELLDTDDLDAFEDGFVSLVMGHLENHFAMPTAASKAAYEIVRGRDYQPSLYRQMMVGSQALAVEVIMDRLAAGFEQVIHELSLIRHEDMPALVDESQMAESDAMRERFLAERESGLRVKRDRSWLFGKGAGVSPAERRRQADEAVAERRRAAADAEAETGLEGDVAV